MKPVRIRTRDLHNFNYRFFGQVDPEIADLKEEVKSYTLYFILI